MAPHSGALAWKIPWTEEPGGLQSMGSLSQTRLSEFIVPAVSCIHRRGSRDLWLSLEAFPRGFPTGQSHVPTWCESILCLKVETVQGKQFSLEWT